MAMSSSVSNYGGLVTPEPQEGDVVLNNNLVDNNNGDIVHVDNDNGNIIQVGNNYYDLDNFPFPIEDFLPELLHPDFKNPYYLRMGEDDSRRNMAALKFYFDDSFRSYIWRHQLTGKATKENYLMCFDPWAFYDYVQFNPYLVERNLTDFEKFRDHIMYKWDVFWPEGRAKALWPMTLPQVNYYFFWEPRFFNKRLYFRDFFYKTAMRTDQLAEACEEFNDFHNYVIVNGQYFIIEQPGVPLEVDEWDSFERKNVNHG